MTQWAYTFGGATWGAGTSIQVMSTEGLGLPDLRIGDDPRASQHGTYVADDWSNGRTITFDLLTGGAGITSSTQLESTWATLLTACVASKTESPLTLEVPGQGARQINVRCRRREVSVDAEYAVGVAEMFVEFYASDPRIYSQTLTQVSTSFPTATGGLTFAALAPFVFGTGGTSGTLDCTNSGTFETPYVVVFNGPLVAPSLEHVVQGKILNLSGATLAAGETLVLDSSSRTVLLNGTASRYSWLTAASQWFTLSPGANGLRFSGGSGSGSVQVSYRNAWL